MLDLGWPLVLTRGAGFTCVNYCCSHSSSQEGKIRIKRANYSCYFLVLNQGITQEAA